VQILSGKNLEGCIFGNQKRGTRAKQAAGKLHPGSSIRVCENFGIGIKIKLGGSQIRALA